VAAYSVLRPAGSANPLHFPQRDPHQGLTLQFRFERGQERDNSNKPEHSESIGSVIGERRSGILLLPHSGGHHRCGDSFLYEGIAGGQPQANV
jgi:hypothetical protein